MRTFSFVGPSGHYRISLHDDDDGSSLEDQLLVVTANGETSHWAIELDETVSGTRTIAGMTRDGSSLWFELRLGSAPEMQYWDNQRLVRADKAV